MRIKTGGFFHIWFTGYTHPWRVAEALRGKPAPHWGVYAQLARALLDSLCLYLPLALMGRAPSTPSSLRFLPTEHYYAISTVMMPVFLMVQWLFLSATAHVILRLSGRRSAMDLILNITGMAALIVGAFLVLWDWAYLLLGGSDPVFLGLSHLAFDLLSIAITVHGFKKLLGVPVGLGILLNGVWLGLGIPLAMVFVRGPV